MLDDFEFLLEILEVDAADRDVGPFFEPFDDPLGSSHRRQLVVDVERVQIPRLHEAQFVIPCRIVLRIVRHQDKGLRVEALYQQPTLVVLRWVVGPAHQCSATRRQNFFRNLKQARDDLSVVDEIEEAEETRLVVMILVVCLVDDRRNSSDRPAVAVRDEWKQLTVIVKWMTAACEARHTPWKRWQEVAIALMQGLRNVLEQPPLLLGLARHDIQQRVPPLIAPHGWFPNHGDQQM